MAFSEDLTNWPCRFFSPFQKGWRSPLNYATTRARHVVHNASVSSGSTEQHRIGIRIETPNQQIPKVGIGSQANIIYIYCTVRFSDKFVYCLFHTEKSVGSYSTMGSYFCINYPNSLAGSSYYTFFLLCSQTLCVGTWNIEQSKELERPRHGPKCNCLKPGFSLIMCFLLGFLVCCA